MQERLDRLTGTAARTGNAVTLLASGVDSYSTRWELLEGARHTIHIVSFSFMRDDTTKRLVELLCDKLAEGVAVRVVVDEAALMTTLSHVRLRRVASEGGEVIAYNKPWRGLGVRWSKGHPFRQSKWNLRRQIKRRFHEKYLVVDGDASVLGGLNWGTKYAMGGADTGGWRDTDCLLRGPVVADVQRQFLTDLLRYRVMPHNRLMNREASVPQTLEELVGVDPGYFPELAADGPDTIRYIPHKPYDDQQLPHTNAALALIGSAEREIWWGCHGVRPPLVVADALAAAAARGVEVNLITNSKRSSRALMGRGLLGWMYWESSNHFRWLLERGIRIHEWQLPGACHSKCMVIDGRVAVVGSYNIANGSVFHHSESSVVVDGGTLPTAVRAQFDVDLADCVEVDIDDTRRPHRLIDPLRRPIHERYLLIDPTTMTPAVRERVEVDEIKWKFEPPPDF